MLLLYVRQDREINKIKKLNRTYGKDICGFPVWDKADDILKN